MGAFGLARETRTAEYKYRLIDMAAGIIGIITDDRAVIAEDDLVRLPDGREAPVIEVYDDEENGKEGGVEATLVVDDGTTGP